MKTRALWWSITLLVMLVLYLLAWPVPIQPAPWKPPPVPSTRDGVYAYNEALAGIERLADGLGEGPEAVALDASGALYAGYVDGRIVRLAVDGGVQVLAETDGRPLGLQPDGEGGVLVVDAVRGLMRVADGYAWPVSVSAAGRRYGFADDLAWSPSTRRVYFTDASYRHGHEAVMADVFEHRGNGRLIAYHLDTDEVQVLADGLYFANGVTLGPDEAYLLVNETTRYRVLRYWLKGERAGELEVFIDNLPGFPDNVRFNGEDRFWLALFAPRERLLDWLLPRPALRKVVYRLPQWLQPAPARHAMVLGLDLDGAVVANLQYRGDDAYAPITTAVEHEGMLYFGSLTQPAIGRIDLAAALASVPGEAADATGAAPAADADADAATDERGDSGSEAVPPATP